MMQERVPEKLAEFCSSELKRTQSILLNVTGDIMR